MPERIQLRRHRGWRKPEGAVVVTRGTDWGNPFVVGQPLEISTPMPYDKQRREKGEWFAWGGFITAEVAVAMFRAWVVFQRLAPQIRSELRGRDLACWCRLDQPCHADVLLEIANQEVRG